MSGFTSRVILLPSDLIPLSRRDQAKNVYMSEKSVRFYPHHNFVAILLCNTHSLSCLRSFTSSLLGMALNKSLVYSHLIKTILWSAIGLVYNSKCHITLACPWSSDLMVLPPPLSPLPNSLNFCSMLCIIDHLGDLAECTQIVLIQTNNLPILTSSSRQIL